MDQEGQRFKFYEENGELKQFPLDFGVVGFTLKTGEMQNITNMYNDEHYNSQIDINTSMPVLSIPIRADENSACVIGILTIVNSKGI